LFLPVPSMKFNPQRKPSTCYVPFLNPRVFCTLMLLFIFILLSPPPPAPFCLTRMFLRLVFCVYPFSYYEVVFTLGTLLTPFGAPPLFMIRPFCCSQLFFPFVFSQIFYGSTKQLRFFFSKCFLEPLRLVCLSPPSVIP